MLRRRTSIRPRREREWKMATFVSALWDNIITFRWQGCRALYSEYKDHREYWGECCHHKSQRLKLWFQIWHYISITQSNRRSSVAAVFRIYRATLRKHVFVSLLSTWNIVTKTRYVFCSPCMQTALFFLSVPSPNYHLNHTRDGHCKSLKSLCFTFTYQARAL